MSQKGERSCINIDADPGHSYADNPSRHSPYISNCTHLDEEFRVDLECGSPEAMANPDKDEKDCRICHLSLESEESSGVAIVLGCSCKDDLAAAHKQCADTWFKIKGNKTCEICGSTAKNVVTPGEIELVVPSNETSTTSVTSSPGETRRFWQGHRFLNFLLACMIFAFVISWLFHFNVPG